MPFNLQKPITYLITSGETTAATASSSEEFSRILNLIDAAVAARISLIQIREKNLSGRLLYELACRAAAIIRGSTTRLLINDRADIAQAAGADGVHLTTRSLDASLIRKITGPDFLIGVSTHTLAEAHAARRSSADFAVFGPVFETSSKRIYGEPIGIGELTRVVRELAPFPIIALGGLDRDNALKCLAAGAAGVAGIRLFSDPGKLRGITSSLSEVRR